MFDPPSCQDSGVIRAVALRGPDLPFASCLEKGVERQLGMGAELWLCQYAAIQEET